ncbi:MAG: hypothetical protein H6Q79_3061 [Deltaproteobacteria bacterium]|nr:hypothetical protein [Deltaproteobacteria bacterium]
MVHRSFPRFSNWIVVSAFSKRYTFRNAAMTSTTPARPEKMAPVTK